MTTLYINIGKLLNVRESFPPLRGTALAELPSIDYAFMLVEDDSIISYGSMTELDQLVPKRPSSIQDVSGRFILPAWCDSHTHLVFAGSRENEFVDKINGLSYAEIAARGDRKSVV